MAVDFDKLCVVARRIEASARMIDVEAVRAAGRQPPLRKRAQIGQATEAYSTTVMGASALPAVMSAAILSVDGPLLQPAAISAIPASVPSARARTVE
jgi:hypothetical protein